MSPSQSPAHRGSPPAPDPGDDRGDALAPPAGGRADGHAIIDEVPSYAGALTGPMGENIRERRAARPRRVHLAGVPQPGRRVPRTRPRRRSRGRTSSGRGEARSGRSVDALLAAYRIGARVSWREMSATAVRNEVDADTLARFAELVFAYIDELSAASVAGHTDELATTGRVRQRLLERLARQLVQGASPEAVLAAAERAGWEPPKTLTAVVVPEAQVRPVLGAARRRDPAGGRGPARAGGAGPAAGPRHRRPATRARAAAAAARPRARSPGRPGRGWRCGPRSTVRCGRSGSASTARHRGSTWPSSS